MSYAYVKNKEDFEKEYPYDKKYIDTYPREYPCVIQVEQQQGGLQGDFYTVDIIEGMQNFIYENDILYKRC